MAAIQRLINIKLNSSVHDRMFGLDIHWIPTHQPKPIVLFFHGFKGLKDWGPWHLMADFFAERGYVFVKFNFSHNGTTIEDPIDFGDLDAFGKNNYTIALADGGDVLDFISSKSFPVPEEEVNLNKIQLIGHSMGGGISILKALEDSRISQLVTLAAVSNLAMWDESILAEWKEKGVRYVFNGRTQQDMPLYYQLAEDYYRNQGQYDLSINSPKLKIPWLIIHGDEDETVPVESAQDLHSKNEGSQLFLIPGGNHTLGGVHPYTSDKLPDGLGMAIKEADRFFRSHL